MSTDMTALKSIKRFLEDKVCPEISLMKPQDDNVLQYELVHPAVHEGYIPPQGLLPEGTEHIIPGILVGIERGEDTGSSASISIRLSFVVFNPGQYTEQGLIPNFEGYSDLLNLITLTKLKLFERIQLDDDVMVEKPVQWGMYESPPYPYWYGYMTFEVPMVPIEYNPDVQTQYK